MVGRYVPAQEQARQELRAPGAAAAGSSHSRAETAGYLVPTDQAESGGSFAGSATTQVPAKATAGGVQGLGYNNANTATVTLVRDLLAGAFEGREALKTAPRRSDMQVAARNLAQRGIVAMARVRGRRRART